MTADPRSHDPSERPAFVAWDRADRLVSLDIIETARRAGHHRWLSIRLFEMLGSWAATVPEVDVKQRMGVHSHRFSWHAELWRDRLPELAEMPPTELTAPPNDDLGRAVDAVAEPTEAHLTIEKLVGAYRVLIPRQLGAYRYQRAHTSEITDGPTARTLSLAITDVAEIWADGEMLVQSLLTTPEHARRATVHQALVEASVIAAGGVCGPGSIG